MKITINFDDLQFRFFKDNGEEEYLSNMNCINYILLDDDELTIISGSDLDNIIRRSCEMRDEDDLHESQDKYPSIEDFTGIEYIQNKSTMTFDIDTDEFDINKLDLVPCNISLWKPIEIDEDGWVLGEIIYDNKVIEGDDYDSDWKVDEILWEK